MAELLLRDLDGDLQVVQERRVNVAELMPRAFCVFGGWNCPSKTDSRTASVPILKSGARHHSASGSPMRNPVAAMRLTIVRYGSWSCASRFAKSAPAMMAGAFFRRRCGRCADIEVVGTIEEGRRVRLDEPLPPGVAGRVRLIILVGEDEPSDRDWLRAATQGGAFDFLNAPEEDRYTLRDGKPFDDAR